MPSKIELYGNGVSKTGHESLVPTPLVPEMPNPDNRQETGSVRSEMTQEIISRRPRLLERWALPIFFAILLIILSAAWFIHYPDVIQANATLTASNAPKEIMSRADGKIVKLFTLNDDKIRQGGMIAWLESTASHQEVISLNNLLDSGLSLLQQDKSDKVSSLFKASFKHLGELQIPYQQFIAAWQLFNDYLVNGYYYKREKVLEQDLDFLKKMHSVTEEQQELTKQDLQLTQEAFDADTSLYTEKVISKQDLRDQKSKLVGKQINLPQIHSTLLTNENQQADKQKDIDELEHSISQQKIIFRQAIQTLKSLTDDWIMKYIIKSPVDGIVVFIVPLQENQFIQSGKLLGFVNPADSRYYAQVNLLQGNFGKITSGQKVQLHFDAYPSQEFGFVAGKLSYISNVPSDSGFLANVELPLGLITNYKRSIQYRSGLKAQAFIVTRDARLLQRFYYSIIKETQR